MFNRWEKIRNGSIKNDHLYCLHDHKYYHVTLMQLLSVLIRQYILAAEYIDYFEYNKITYNTTVLN